MNSRARQGLGIALLGAVTYGVAALVALMLSDWISSSSSGTGAELFGAAIGLIAIAGILAVAVGLVMVAVALLRGDRANR